MSPHTAKNLVAAAYLAAALASGHPSSASSLSMARRADSGEIKAVRQLWGSSVVDSPALPQSVRYAGGAILSSMMSDAGGVPGLKRFLQSDQFGLRTELRSTLGQPWPSIAEAWRTTIDRLQTGPSSDSIRRLAPDAFPTLPAAIRRDLAKRQCLVPQPWDAAAPGNVVRGAFTAAGANEWAVLCSVRDTSQILIYRIETGRAARVVDSLLPTADRDWMQAIGGGRSGYSRLLQTRPLRKIRAWRRDVDGQPIPQPIDHDAIDQLFVGKSGEAFYYVAGRLYRQVVAD